MALGPTTSLQQEEEDIGNYALVLRAWKTHTHTHTHITATTSDFYSYFIGQNQSHAHNKFKRDKEV